MDLTVVSTNENIYKCDDGCARALLAAFPEAFKRIERPAPVARPTTPRFVVFRMETTDEVALKCEKPNGETLFFIGEPSDAATVLRVPVPEDVLERYRNARLAPVARPAVDPFSGKRN